MNTDFLKRLPGRALWHMPWPFGAAAVLGKGYSLRCVLFHNVTDRASSYTDGLGVSLTTDAFEETIRFLVRHYTPVSLEEALHTGGRARSVKRPVLVTFDDAYASVAVNAAPICHKYRVPALYFVNARFLDNRELSLDNLVCHVVNSEGYRAINAVASDLAGSPQTLQSFRQIFGQFVPSLPLSKRCEFHAALSRAAGIDAAERARDGGLYLASAQLAALAASGWEIGNHTYSHVHGRTLAERELVEEIDRNRSVLESITARRVRSFSVPYGSSKDLPPHLARHLDQRGYEAVFLVERLMNTAVTPVRGLHRVSVQQGSDADLFSELEVMPRLRMLRGALLRTTANVHP